MGSWGSITFGAYDRGHFKSQIPLETLLLFTQDDLVIEGEGDEGEHARRKYSFVTDACTARRRLDSRGLDLDLCRWLYDQFRSDWVWLLDPAIGKSEHVENTLSFDRYLDALRPTNRQQGEEAQTGAPNEATDDADKDADLEVLSGIGFFDSDAERYYDDILGCMYYRCLLEVIPEDTPVELEFSELVGGGYIPEDNIEGIFDYFMRLVLGRIELDYLIYGFVIEEDPHIDARLRDRLMELNEDQFLDHVLRPLLKKIGYENVKTLHFHGPSEFGFNILPFRYTTPLGTVEYYAVQAKAVPIHGTSSKAGNAAELISQATQAFAVTFVDEMDNERKRIDKFIIATNKKITADARHFIEDAIESKRRIVFLDTDRIVALVKEHGLLRYLLFSDLE
jgi:hypothetical protein